MRNWIHAAIVAGTFAGTFVSAAHGQNIVGNPGFDGNANGWSPSFPHPGSTQHNYISNFGHTAPGCWAFTELQPLDDSISQAFAATPNASYTFSFWVYNFGSGSDHLFATWNGVTVVDQRPVAQPVNQWSQVSVQVTAGPAGAAIRIGGYDTASFLVIDDVSVVANAPLCVADTDDGSGTGTRDGGVTIDDLLYYLVIFEQGSLASDVDDGSGTGTLDGGVTIDDLLYFLVRFESGC